MSELRKIRRAVLVKNGILFAILIVFLIVFGMNVEMRVRMINIESDISKIRNAEEVLVKMGKTVDELNKRFESDYDKEQPGGLK